MSDALSYRPPRPPSSDEKAIYAIVVGVGRRFGEKYPNVWDSDKNLLAAFEELTKQTDAVALRVKNETRKSGALWWFLASVVMFVVSVMTGGSLSWGGVSLMLVSISGMLAVNSSTRKAKAYSENSKWFRHVALFEASEAILARRQLAKAHDPSSRDQSAAFVPAGPPPPPQPFGVSHEGAEHLCAQWMKYLGEADAEVTRFVADGGIDVGSLHYVAQVKNYTGSVGVAEVRELAGVSHDDGRKPLFFTSGSYASGAVDFASRVGIALFIYNSSEGTLTGANSIGELALARGL